MRSGYRIIKLAFAVMLALFASAHAALGQTFYGSTDLKVFRDGRDKEFRNKEGSPLKEEDFGKFTGLNYFPIDKDFRVTARFRRTPDERWFEMPTSSEKSKKFVKYGTLSFTLKGKPFTLGAYKIDPEVSAKFPEYADLLFVPFRDLTNRDETYQAGRYIDIRMPKGRYALIDFNLAYNPNCAYGGTKWSCPIPPRENALEIAVTAGEKRYAYSGIEKAH
jgi:uncharacterized protein